MANTTITYRVEELATQAGIGVDTIRYYQGMGLLPPTGREGRTVVYSSAHLTRLTTIRALAEDGFSLAQIKQLLQDSGHPLLASLAGPTLGLSRQELAEGSGLPLPLVDMAVSAGLVEPLENRGEEELFAPEVVPMLAAGMLLLEAGFPIDRLAALAARHATSVENVVDGAINLFNEHVRDAQTHPPEEVAKLFRVLLLHVTRLVAHHFQRTVITRVRERLESSGDQALVTAFEDLETRRMTVYAEWR
ncbi:MAG: MerR family transcriptional regulator [Acidimicrobiia bacterium]|nr:MerR family transcriptional regulator [bacterium]MXX63974.1 MerR family transcriptional regulator [Acidimicrobiia bacterium]MYF27007.1 MerR family transcriptional regulator [Acidimicrobiia bacterium]